jgi:hypothetical protein
MRLGTGTIYWLSVALPTAYLTSYKNVDGILTAIKTAQAPPRFTQKFLESLGFASPADRLFINVLKTLGFLNDTGVPVQRYHEFLDQTQSGYILADGIRDAYADLFQINIKAQEMTHADVRNKMKTLSQGQYSDSVLEKMAGTFKALSKNADFSHPAPAKPEPPQPDPAKASGTTPPAGVDQLRVGGLVYSINIQLPESRDPAVYDALFKSLKEHLLK